ncbi:MAG: MarR family transcriptional regulator [Alphaproteobacteria bacterium]|nr:MarR family transcriptional regulator [Alphaproteobacteria bacterium]
MRRFVDDYLAYLLAAASAHVSADFHKQLRPSGLSVPKWRVLATLSDGRPMSIGELARIVLLQQPTVTKLAYRMARVGLVTLASDPADRRRTLVRIAPAGAGAVKPLLRRAKAHERRCLSSYSTVEVAKVKEILKDLLRRSAPQ